ncbi:MAG: hypothetical protein OEL57_03690 [Trichlorobacter sp.]|uniref:hypothetical protein n=1 Tax=Trichlorobacter sp. TaxID=2911007 RepID=UPI0025619B5A|nr:hypothetical protein [Trichlorobacter sp.]MDK9716994.1 hypothetical protein [Trichlorobacter sp.]
MSRRLFVPLVAALLVIAALGAVAAVNIIEAPAVTVVPEVYKGGEDGYFRIVTKLPKRSSNERLILTPRVEEGDLFLVTVTQAPPQKGKHARTDGAKTEQAEELITVTGRYQKAGPGRLAIRSRNTKGDLLRLTFTLPGADVTTDATIRTEWAKQYQWSLWASDPNGEDPYTQYWNLAVAPRYGLDSRYLGSRSRSRRETPDLYSVFTGAAAIQETLQLELLDTAPRRSNSQNASAKVVEDVALSTLQGPQVKSHPFKEMLKGRTPALPLLASYIPDDQYAVFFANINKQIELADLMDEWGGNLLRQVESNAQDFKVREKVSRQLCLENSMLTRMFGDRVVADMAITGSDPFLKEGTAVTVLFSLKDASRFRKQIEKQYSEAVKTRGAVRSELVAAGKRVVAVVTPDLRVSSYMVLAGNLGIVSTSKAALERVLAVEAKQSPALAQADDFRYMRTIFPQDAKEEDIFIYLSDSHIRNLVGPQWKIAEARRMRCSANMGLIANARLWFKTEKRREPTMDELVAGGYLGKNPPVCPEHGTYAIDKQGEVYCPVHNRPGKLTPLNELKLTKVTPDEASQYRDFVANYNRYWTQFFDPIGIRVKLGQNIRIQTCILPLIENSWYDGLAAFSGRTPGLVTDSAVLPRTVFSVRGHMAQDWLEKSVLGNKRVYRNNLELDWLGNEVAINLCDGQVLFSADGRLAGLLGHEVGRSSSIEPLIIGYLASAINLPTYLTVKVTDPKKAEQSIPELFRAIGPREYSSRDELSLETYTLENHRGKPIYVANFTLFVVKLRLYTAVVDDRLVIASRRDIITDLLDASAKGAAKKVIKHDGNMELSVYRSAFKQLEEASSIGYQEDIRHACQKNLPLAAILMRNLGVPSAGFASTAEALRGYQPYCPSGGTYRLDENTGALVCSVHGNLHNPKQPAFSDQASPTMRLINSLDRVNARLTFTPEGLMTTVDIQRKSGKKSW